tara:strand:- start:173 stop:538 length:366 start_codon:yes stop_codon:yes gene_type:complete
MNNQNNINHLPNDLMSLILSIRTEEMKKDKRIKEQIKEQIKENKEKYNNFVNSFKEKTFLYKDDILRDRYGTKGLYKEEEMDLEGMKRVLDKWELWEIDNLLTPIEEEGEDEERINFLNWY